MDISISSNLEPLFVWTVIAYLIILFHLFNIEQIQLKIKGIEILFVSTALGTLFYGIFLILNATIIGFLYALIKNLSVIITTLPFTFNPFIREAHIPFSTSSEIVCLIIFLIAFLDWIVITIFSIVIKIIQFCLDSNNEIFPSIERFKFIQKFNLNTLITGIPWITFILGFYVLIVSSIIGIITNFTFIESPLKWEFNVIINLFFLVLMIIFGAFLTNWLYNEYQLWKPFLEYLIRSLSTIKSENRYENVTPHPWILKIETWIIKYRNWVFFIILFILLFIAVIGALYDVLFPHYCGIGYCVYTL